MDMKFFEILAYYRRRSEKSLVQLADEIGVTANYLGNIEKKYSKAPTKERCLQIAKALRLSADETEQMIQSAIEERMKGEQLEFVETIKNKVRLVPVISWVNANRFGTIEDPFPLGSADEHVPTATKGENVFALKIKNDCMFDHSGKHSFREGEKIIVNPNAEVLSGDFAVVRDAKAQEATFKQYIKRGKKVILHPLNPKYPDIELDHDERYEIIGKVVGVYRDV